MTLVTVIDLGITMMFVSAFGLAIRSACKHEGSTPVRNLSWATVGMTGLVLILWVIARSLD